LDGFHFRLTVEKFGNVEIVVELIPVRIASGCGVAANITAGILVGQLLDDVERIFLERVAADDGIAMRAGRPRFPALVETPGIPGNRSWLLVRTGETGSCSCDGRCRSTGKCVAIGRGVFGRSIFRGGIFVVLRLVRQVSERIVEINWREKLV